MRILCINWQNTAKAIHEARFIAFRKAENQQASIILIRSQEIKQQKKKNTQQEENNKYQSGINQMENLWQKRPTNPKSVL